MMRAPTVLPRNDAPTFVSVHETMAIDQENGTESGVHNEQMVASSNDELPIAQPIMAPSKQTLDRQLEERKSSIPSATPIDLEQEERLKRRRLCITSAIVVAVALVVSTVLGVTFRGSLWNKPAPVDSQEGSLSPTHTHTKSNFCRIYISTRIDGVRVF